MIEFLNSIFNFRQKRVMVTQKVDLEQVKKDLAIFNVKYTPQFAAANHEMINYELNKIWQKNTTKETVYF
jgi:hypothetical protein